MKKRLKSNILTIVLIIYVNINVNALIPTQIHYQGRLNDAIANPINGQYKLIYNIYNSSINGSVLWSETQDPVQIAEGVLDVFLGMNVPINIEIFDENIKYLELRIGPSGGSTEILSPRSILTASPYSYVSEKSYILIGSTLTTLNGNLGIGTTNPIKKLHVLGDACISNSVIIGNGIVIDYDNISNNTTGVYLFTGNDVSACSKYYYLDISDVGDGTGLRFVKNNSNGETVTAMLSWNGDMLIPAGNLGVGTTEDNFKLVINGDVNLSNGYNYRKYNTPISGSSYWTIGTDVNIYRLSKVGIGTTNPIAGLTIKGGNTTGLQNSESGVYIDEGSGIPRIELRSNGLINPYIDFTNDLSKDYKARIVYNSSDDNLELLGSDIYIANNLGICTNNQQSKLSIKNINDCCESLLLMTEHTIRGIGMVISTACNMGIGVTNPQYRLELPNIANSSGQGRANAWQTYSSVRWKKEITPISDALEKTINLTGVNFYWKDTNKYDMGLIAEDVGKVVPEIVDYEENGYAKGMKYDRLVALLIEAIKQLNKEIEGQNEQVIIRNEKLTILQNRINKINRQ
jgi:hypothetical protein